MAEEIIEITYSDAGRRGIDPDLGQIFRPAPPALQASSAGVFSVPPGRSPAVPRNASGPGARFCPPRRFLAPHDLEFAPDPPPSADGCARLRPPAPAAH